MTTPRPEAGKAAADFEMLASAFEAAFAEIDRGVTRVRARRDSLANAAMGTTGTPGCDGNFADVESDTLEEGRERRVVRRNFTQDQIAILRRCGRLSMQEAEAGRRLQILRERASIGGLKGQELERAFQDVDVVAGRDTHIPEQVAWAFWKLRAIRKAMWPPNWQLVTMVAWDNLTAAEILGRFPRHHRDSIGPRIGDAFSQLVSVIDNG